MGYNIKQNSDGSTSLVNEADSVEVFKLNFDGSIDLTTATNALLIGSGLSGSEHALGTSAGDAIEFRFDATHTSGDMRGMYLRVNYEGVGGSGEALRAFGVVNNVTAASGGTVNGGHISLQIDGASGKVSGAGNALRATLGVGTGSTPGGTLAAIQVDSFIASGVTLPGTTSFLRFTNTGAVNIDKLMAIPDVASGGLLAVHVTQVMSHSIRIMSHDGTAYYLMVSDTVTNRTGGG